LWNTIRSKKVTEKDWVWRTESPEALARFVSPRCAVAAFGGVDRIEDRTKFDVIADGDLTEAIGALYQMLREEQIDYDKEGYLAGSVHSQKIRNPIEIKDRKVATCLDISLLFSALALDLGLRPILILLEDHALVALSTATGFDLVIDRESDRDAVMTMLENEQLIPLEITGCLMGDRVDLDLGEALERGRQTVINGEFEAAVDPQFLHERDFVPIDCPGGSRVGIGLVSSVGVGAVALAVAGVWFLAGRGGLTVFDDDVAGVVLLPSVEAVGEGPAIVSKMTGLFDEELVDEVGGETGPLTNYVLAENTDGNEITVSDPVLRAEAAADIVSLTNAGVVISPTLNIGSNRASVDVDAWLGQVDSAEELGGLDVSFLLCGSRASVTGDFSEIDNDTRLGMDELAEETSEQIAHIDTLLQAVSSYRRFRYPEADSRLSRLIDLFKSDRCRAGPEVALLHHMRGNIQADLGNFDDAEEFYGAALDLDDEFSRALLGLAGVGLTRALVDGCNRSDNNDINLAIRRYGEFLGESETAGDPVLSLQGLVGRGRAQVCQAGVRESLGQSSANVLTRAKADLNRALTNYEALKAADDPLWRSATETAAIGYLTRADLARRGGLSADGSSADGDSGDDGGDDGLLPADAALADYERASDTSTRPWVLAQAQLGVAEVCEAIGDTDCENDARFTGCDYVDEAKGILGEEHSVATDDLATLSDALCV